MFRIGSDRLEEIVAEADAVVEVHTLNAHRSELKHPVNGPKGSFRRVTGTRLTMAVVRKRLQIP